MKTRPKAGKRSPVGGFSCRLLPASAGFFIPVEAMAETPNTGERLASLEADARHTTIQLDDIQKDLDEIARDVGEIKLGLHKQRGFIAGIMFVVTPLWAVVVVMAKAVWDKFSQ